MSEHIPCNQCRKHGLIGSCQPCSMNRLTIHSLDKLVASLERVVGLRRWNVWLYSLLAFNLGYVSAGVAIKVWP